MRGFADDVEAEILQKRHPPRQGQRAGGVKISAGSRLSSEPGLRPKGNRNVLAVTAGNHPRQVGNRFLRLKLS